MIEAHRFEDLRPAVTLLRGDAHLAHHLQQPLADSLDEIAMQLVTWDLWIEHPLSLHLVERGKSEVRIYGPSTVAGEHREVLHLTGFRSFHNNPAPRPGTFTNEMVMHASGCEQRGHRCHFARSPTIGEHQDRGSIGHSLRCLSPDLIEPLSHPRSTFSSREEH